jgi:hypothetical protein
MALLACDRPSAAPPRDAPVVAAATSSAPSVPAPSVVPPALASTSRAPARDRPPPVPSSLVAAPPRPIGGATFLSSAVDPDADPVWIARLASAPIVDLRWNGGGTSVTLRATFADGRRAVMKPAQTRSSSNHRGEIAAYHVDRLVGFGRTAVVVGRRVPRGLIEQATMSDSERARVEAEVARESTVEVAMIAWHDGPLVDDTPPRDALVAGPPLSPDLALRVAAWSDLHAFDFLIDNTDRWSGGNVLAKGKGGPLVFLDNASSFLPGRARARSTMSKDLAPVCRFSAATVARLRALASVDSSLSAALRDSLAKDPLAPVLDDLTRQAIDTRLRSLITHVDECVRAHGEAAVVIR